MGNRFLAKNVLAEQEITELQKMTNLSVDDIKERHKKVEIYNLLKFDFDISDKVACENAFAAFDKNQNGTIEFNEFVLAMVFLRPNTVESNVDLFFQWFDVSGDGYIDYQELIRFFESVILLVKKNTSSKTAEQTASEVFEMFALQNKQRTISQRMQRKSDSS